MTETPRVKMVEKEFILIISLLYRVDIMSLIIDVAKFCSVLGDVDKRSNLQ